MTIKALIRTGASLSLWATSDSGRIHASAPSCQSPGASLQMRLSQQLDLKQ
jgi:hypothetical protein